MGEQVVVVGVKQRGFVVVAQVFEQEVIAALDDAKVEVVGCLDDIAICNGEVIDGVFAFGEFKDVCTISSSQGVLGSGPKGGVVAAATFVHAQLSRFRLFDVNIQNLPIKEISEGLCSSINFHLRCWRR